MTKKVVILKDTAIYDFGQIVEGEESGKGLIVENSDFIPNTHYLEVRCDEYGRALKEDIDNNDVEKVREIVRDMLEHMFWRLYTRSSFVLK